MRKWNAGTWRRVGAGVVLAATAAVVLAAGGSLDTGFGTGGVVTVNAGSSTAVLRTAMQADGKTLECGWTATTRVDELGNTIYEWQVRRFTAAGVLDPAYGVGGLVRLFGDTAGQTQAWGLIHFSDNAYDVAVDAAGRAVVVGLTAVKTVTTTIVKHKPVFSYSWKEYTTLARLDVDGNLDASFGSGGVVRTSIPGDVMSYPNNVVIQPDGRIAVVGLAWYPDLSTHKSVYLARFLADGSLDAGFGSGGIALDPQGPSGAITSARGLALQASGALVVAEGRSPNFWILRRFTSAGAPDTTFATIATTDSVNGLVVDRLDRIVATGTTPTVNGASDMRVARYLPNGTADASFGAGGVVTINAYAKESATTNAVFQPADDKIVFGAMVGAPAPAYMASTTVRLTDSGALDSTYGSGGIGALITLSATTHTRAADVELAPDGGIVLGGSLSSTWFIAKYTGN